MSPTITVLSLWTDHIKHYAIPVNKIREKYCESQGYRLKTCDHSLDETRHPAWSKLKFILQEWDDGNYLYWNDADCVLHDFTTPVTDIVDLDFDINLGVDGPKFRTRHTATPYIPVWMNTGNIFIRCTDDTRYWFDKVYTDETYKMWHSPNFYCWEQSALEQMYTEEVEFRNKVNLVEPFFLFNSDEGSFLKHALGDWHLKDGKTARLQSYCRDIITKEGIQDFSYVWGLL